MNVARNLHCKSFYFTLTEHHSERSVQNLHDYPAAPAQCVNPLELSVSTKGGSGSRKDKTKPNQTMASETKPDGKTNVTHGSRPSAEQLVFCNSNHKAKLFCRFPWEIGRNISHARLHF
jgi:hypothetical protein